jgi:hypothetical protein
MHVPVVLPIVTKIIRSWSSDLLALLPVRLLSCDTTFNILSLYIFHPLCTHPMPSPSTTFSTHLLLSSQTLSTYQIIMSWFTGNYAMQTLLANLPSEHNPNIYYFFHQTSYNSTIEFMNISMHTLSLNNQVRTQCNLNNIVMTHLKK